MYPNATFETLGAYFCNLATFMSVKQHVVGFAHTLLGSACISSLWRLVWRLSNMCLLLQHERMWRELSICLSGQKLQSCEMSCSRTCFFW